MYNIFYLRICSLHQTSQFTNHLLKDNLLKYWEHFIEFHSYFPILRKRNYGKIKLSCWRAGALHVLFSILFCTQHLIHFKHTKIWEKKMVKGSGGPTSPIVPHPLWTYADEWLRKNTGNFRDLEEKILRTFRSHEISKDSFLNYLNISMAKIISNQDRPSKIRSVQLKLED